MGVRFGQKDYVLTILKAVEDEVHRNPRLKSRYPWFDDPEFADERMAKRVRLSADEKAEIKLVQGILRGTALQEAERFTSGGRSPPGDTDCWLLAFGQVREAIVVTDDLGMHELAQDFDIKIWHGYELLDKLRSAKVVDANLIRDIYEALERNGDLTKTWVEAKHKLFGRIFGPGK
ncbi:MAG: hypothetical protein RLZZ271_910 [Pseudomonadota bacterium]